MDVKRVLEMIEEELQGYNKWLMQTDVTLVKNILINKMESLKDLARRIEKEMKKEGE